MDSNKNKGGIGGVTAQEYGKTGGEAHQATEPASNVPGKGANADGADADRVTTQEEQTPGGDAEVVTKSYDGYVRMKWKEHPKDISQQGTLGIPQGLPLTPFWNY